MSRQLIALLFPLLAAAAHADSGRADYDLDDDGLIEINDLADLDEIRNNLDGSSLYGSSNGCPADGCVGFELTTDLDFDTNGDGVMDELDDYWNDGSGWEGVGKNVNSFQAVFEGNGHLIRNLYIDRPNTGYQGLFGYTQNARIQNIGLTGPQMAISGRSCVGAVVGYTYATSIEGVFSTGSVRGEGWKVGGLVGCFTGEAELSAVFSTGSVTSESYDVGGLVGYLYDGQVHFSYATGRIEGTNNLGGLIGGKDSSAVVETSYWATDLSSQPESAGGIGAELLELQCPVGAENSICAASVLYERWGQIKGSDGSAYWDFGTGQQLPALVLNGNVYRDSDGDGVLDENDDLPFNPAASKDLDEDGHPDAWNLSCDSICREASGLVLDHFPGNVAAAVDTDLDGQPEKWNSGCDQSCQDSSGLMLDTHPGDADNDGVADSEHPHANGLINIDNLAQLNAIRYSMEGVGRRMTADGELDLTGCPVVLREGIEVRRCHGYELARDLDFDTNGDGVMDELDDYWNDGAGWESIGGWDSSFQAVFEGNGHVIRNLYVNRTRYSFGEYHGLFGHAENAHIQNIGLTGLLTSIRAYNYVGALVGYSNSTVIEGVFSTGFVQGHGRSVGGLVGFMSGESQLRAAFFTGSIIGESGSGGLVGHLSSGDIQSSYATGRVEGVGASGGLVRYQAAPASVETSYWATDLSGQPESAGGLGVQLSELRCPVAADNSTCSASILYEGWGQIRDSDGNAYWEFGTGQQLPALVLNGNVYRDGDGDGVLDEDDDLPFNSAASKDLDKDGYPDRWRSSCDTECRDASGLVLDQFPENAAASIDTDLDSLPDEWNSGCAQSCQNNSGLTMDSHPGDADNDGVADSEHPHANGLINIDNLAQLHAIRYSMEGVGRRMGGEDELDVTGCPAVVHEGTLQRRCYGYELTKDLDFDTNGDGVMDELDDYWNDGAGWESIGERDNSFEAVFEGNGHVIRNLYINRTGAFLGLFGRADNARIQNVGLTGLLMSVSGYNFVGALVGYSNSTFIEGVFSTGSVQSDGTFVGGLVGHMTGESQLRAAFSTGPVTGEPGNGSGYAPFVPGDIGGLVGELDSGEIQSSYSTGRVKGTRSVGGLIGAQDSPASVAVSHWAIDLSGQLQSAGGIGAQLSELRCPVAANNSTCATSVLYAQWDQIQGSDGNAYWDFGTDEQLPALVLAGKIYRDSDGDGVLDEEDDLPLNPGAYRDVDGDGYPNAWRSSCDTACREMSGLVLDQLPNNPAAAVDADLDGLPEEWNSDCDQSCQKNSGLALDTYPADADNDGVPDSEHPHANGLININNLEQLHAIRYSMEGAGRQMSAEGDLDVTGCPAVVHEGFLQRRCNGYELTEDLDFDSNNDGLLNEHDDYWNGGSGWESIGGLVNPFEAVFEGNGHVIRNLYIDRSNNYQGLFGYVKNARIQNIGLTGALMSVSGTHFVGALTGASSASVIEGVFSTGSVEGESYSVGGLMGVMGGESQLRAAFSTGSVESESYEVGGLVGELYSGEIRFSYATGRIEGSSDVGGLVGKRDSSAPVESSYWATDQSGQPGSAGGVGAQLSELQCPKTAGDDTCSASTLYERWDQAESADGSSYWDFGTDQQLPALVLTGKTYRDSDSDGALDRDDAFVANPAASQDADEDGFPDAWHEGCDDICQSNSGLILDERLDDTDNDGVVNDEDDFPQLAEAAVDTDGDGNPDAWNENCDTTCQSESALSLDTDNDGDGIDNDPDAFPLIAAASVDADEDGLPDAWHEGCDTGCQESAGLTLDEYLDDTDNDGVINDADAFPLIAAASVDADEDGLPDAWHDGCDTSCQDNSGLTLDGRPNDTDNDGAVNEKDAFPANPAASMDADEDGLPDAWHEGCDASCQENSGLALDGHLDDTDNDGVVNDEDDFPQLAEASVDTDGDGNPDAWNESCDAICQSGSALTLDTDNDGDGIDNDADAFPLIAAASVDADEDGFPDAWNEGCDSICESESGLTLDEHLDDTDNDGAINDIDAFPLIVAAALDADEDGLPDAWHDGCDTSCQDSSGLTLDEHLNDTDNDGVVNDQDAFPANPAASVDADEDGLPDEWLDGCNSSCQGGSGLTLDESLSDSDNDGIANDQDHYPTDPDHWEDDVAPEMVLVPAPMHVASTGELTEVTLNVEDAGGYDSFSDSVSFRVYYDEERLAWDDQYRVELPVGKVILSWVAVDSAGNESAPMPQEVNVYPQVSFTESESVTGENNAALVNVSLTGPSPVYPITLKAHWVEADSTANAEDVLTNGEGAVDLNELTAVIESEEELTDAGFIVPFVQDDQPEMDEQLVLTLQAAYAGEQTDDNESEESRFVMPLIESSTGHRLTITDANLAPTLALSIKQGGESVQVVRQDGGEVTVEATITDANGGDEHQLEWYTSDLPFVVSNAEHRFTFNPIDLDAGDYSISALVTDNGNPALSSQEVTLAWQVEMADSEEETEDEVEEEAGEEAEEGDSGGGQAGGASSGGSGGGHVSLWLLMALFLMGCSRQRAIRRMC